MPKAMIVLVVLFAAGICYVVYVAGKAVLGGPPETAEVKKPEKPAPKGSDATEKAAERAKAFLNKAKHKFKETTSDAVETLRGPAIKLTVAETPIVMNAGTPKEVKIHRSNDAKMEALQLKFFPATDSKLTVKGGAFSKGATETSFTIEAQAGGLDASLKIQADERAQILVPVRVK